MYNARWRVKMDFDWNYKKSNNKKQNKQIHIKSNRNLAKSIHNEEKKK